MSTRTDGRKNGGIGYKHEGKEKVGKDRGEYKDRRKEE